MKDIIEAMVGQIAADLDLALYESEKDFKPGMKEGVPLIGGDDRVVARFVSYDDSQPDRITVKLVDGRLLDIRIEEAK